MVLKVGIAGIRGRMGQALQQAIEGDARVTLAAASARTTNDIPLPTGCYARQYSPQELAAACDAVIDFTHPDYSLELAQAVAEMKKTHIIGTTGFSDSDIKQLQMAAKHAVIVWSGNMSMGVSVVASLVEQTARALGVEYDIEISEMHHRHKKDAPSGTSLMLAQAAAKGRGIKLADAERMYGKGMIGERERGTIGLSVRRGGDVVGEHEVLFAGEGEVISIRHQGFNRQIYARGAIAAALWAKGKPAGFYSMRDVLGLTE